MLVNHSDDTQAKKNITKYISWEEEEREKLCTYILLQATYLRSEFRLYSWFAITFRDILFFRAENNWNSFWFPFSLNWFVFVNSA